VARTSLTLLMACLVLGLVPPAASPQTPTRRPAAPPNIVLITADDLNHWVGYLGRNPQARTPAIDRIAAEGVAFMNAHVPAPACNPARAAMFSGLRPSSTGVYGNSIDWRPQIPTSATMLTFFRRSGYRIVGAGKFYHDGFERPEEWDAYMKATVHEPGRPAGDDGVGGIKFGPIETDDAGMHDYEVANWVIEQLERKSDKPLFVSCGFAKPHMPWNVPKKYFDQFPLAGIKLPPYKHNDLDDVPPAGVRFAGNDHETMLASGRWKEAIQAYLASIAFVDTMIGRVFEAIRTGPNRDNTIVVVMGDNGFNLGEKRHWRKFSLWEESTRVPVVIFAPGIAKAGGRITPVVDLMGLYPTLAELAGLNPPAHVEGRSFKSLLEDPGAPWESVAVTTYGERNHAVRTAQWRYIRYSDGGEELYNLKQDPYEWDNLAGRPEMAAVKTELAKHFPAVNKPAAPAVKAPGGDAQAGRQPARVIRK